MILMIHFYSFFRINSLVRNGSLQIRVKVPDFKSSMTNKTRFFLKMTDLLSESCATITSADMVQFLDLVLKTCQIMYNTFF